GDRVKGVDLTVQEVADQDVAAKGAKGVRSKSDAPRSVEDGAGTESTDEGAVSAVDVHNPAGNLISSRVVADVSDIQLAADGLDIVGNVACGQGWVGEVAGESDRMERGVEHIDRAAHVGGIQICAGPVGADGQAGIAGSRIRVLGYGVGAAAAVPAKNRAGLCGENKAGGKVVPVGQKKGRAVAIVDLSGRASGDRDDEGIDRRRSRVKRREVGAIIGHPEGA